VESPFGLEVALRDVVKMTPDHKRQSMQTARPATGKDPARAFRLSDEFIEKVDAWAAHQEDLSVRSEVIRRLVEIGLKAKNP